MTLKTGISTVQFTLVEALIQVEERDNAEELCRTIRVVRDILTNPSLEEKWTLGRALLRKFSGWSVALPGKSVGKNYVEVVQKMMKGERPVGKVLQPAAVRSLAQRAAEDQKGENTKSEDDKVVVIGESRHHQRWRMYWNDQITSFLYGASGWAQL